MEMYEEKQHNNEKPALVQLSKDETIEILLYYLQSKAEHMN